MQCFPGYEVLPPTALASSPSTAIINRERDVFGTEHSRPFIERKDRHRQKRDSQRERERKEEREEKQRETDRAMFHSGASPSVDIGMFVLRWSS